MCSRDSMNRTLLWLLLIEVLVLVVCVAAAEMETTSLSPDSAEDDSSSEEDEYVSGSEERRRRRRSLTDEVADSDEKTVVEDIATIGKIIQLLQAIGQKVIPIFAQGAAAVNKLLANINA